MSYELQFLTVAVIFTGLGWYFGCDFMARRMVALTIDNLIADGFIRYRIDENGETVIMKWYEEK